MYEQSYGQYKAACSKHDLEPVDYIRYMDLVRAACLKLTAMKITLDKCPYISYIIEGMVVKFKKVDEGSVEINFFVESDYTDIISKYKEK